MPSSSSPMQSDHYTTVLPPHQEEAHEYRQTIYHDKAGVQIAECRRRAGVARGVEQSTQTYVDFILYPANSMQSSSKVHTHNPSCRAVPDMKLDESSNHHVTSAKHSPSRPKPAIIQRTSESTRKLPGEDKTPLSFSGEPTPPPTPRMLRLPTPELPDLKEAPFCNCGIRRHVVRRCRTCSKEADIWSV